MALALSSGPPIHVSPYSLVRDPSPPLLKSGGSIAIDDSTSDDQSIYEDDQECTNGWNSGNVPGMSLRWWHGHLSH